MISIDINKWLLKEHKLGSLLFLLGHSLKCHQIHKHTNAQTHKHKYTNAKIHKYLTMQGQKDKDKPTGWRMEKCT